MGEILIDITPEQWEALKKSKTITIETKNPIPVESGSEVICYILNTGIVGKFEVNASKEDVQSALDMSQEKFNAMMAEYERQNRRVSFA